MVSAAKLEAQLESSSASVAAAAADGTDGHKYLVVAEEGTVTGGTGYFRGVTKAVVRCTYKVDPDNPLLLIACVDRVLILVRQ